jgi:Predicted transcriptional regulators
MKYTVGQFSQLLGISAETLRHYDRIGLLRSQRDQDSRYRRYSLEDILPVLGIRQQRSMGMSLSDVAEGLQDMSLVQQQMWVQDKEGAIDAEIERLQQMKQNFHRFHQRLERAQIAQQSKGVVRAEMLPVTHSLFLGVVGMPPISHLKGLVQTWVENIYFTHISLYIIDPFKDSERFNHIAIGLGLLESVQSSVQLPRASSLLTTSSGSGMAMTLSITDPLSMDPSLLTPMRDYARQAGVNTLPSISASVDHIRCIDGQYEYTMTFRTLLNRG